MPEWLIIALLTLMAGGTMSIGALLATFDRLRPNWMADEQRHAIIAFGGGALFSAIALVLVPEGSARLPVWAVAIFFGSGGLAFMGLDVWLARHRSPASQLAAMLTDFVPEALALGATFGAGTGAGPLLALLIALQNLPEGFNASRELTSGGNVGPWKVVFVFVLMAGLGPIAGLAGYFLLGDHPEIVGAIMLFAGGGILYLIFQDIAPQAKLERSWAPPLGAVFGFLLGLLGDLLIGLP